MCLLQFPPHSATNGVPQLSYSKTSLAFNLVSETLVHLSADTWVVSSSSNEQKPTPVVHWRTSRSILGLCRIFGGGCIVQSK